MIPGRRSFQVVLCLIAGLALAEGARPATPRPEAVPGPGGPGHWHEAPQALHPDDPRWQGLFNDPGLDGQVFAIVRNGPDLYVGGNFQSAGGVPARCVARFDGERWHPLGPGLTVDHWFYKDPVVHALAIYNGELYAGGVFTRAGNDTVNFIARWDGQAWHDVGGGAEDWIASFAVFDGQLIAGGRFIEVGNLGVARIAAWDGARWHRVGSGVYWGDVTAMTVWRKQLYVGGIFSEAGGIYARNVARWDGRHWYSLGSGIRGHIAYVSAMSVYQDQLLVGGYFDSAGAVAAEGAAAWDGADWRPVTPGIQGSGDYKPFVTAMAPRGNDDLFVTGFFLSIDGVEAQNMALWNGVEWSAVGGGSFRGLYTLLVEEDKTVLLGGAFQSIGDQRASGLARWTDDGWRPVGRGAPVEGTVLALAEWDDAAVAAGEFVRAGGTATRRVAAWSGVGWNPLGDGFNDQVLCLAAWNGRLLAGGWFDSAGAAPAAHLAAWDGSTWSEFGGADGVVRCLAAQGSELFAGGEFTSIGGVPAVNVARFDGLAWHPLGVGIGGPVRALAIWNGQPVVGGQFTQADGQAALRVAGWDGTAWRPLGGGVNGRVNALTVWNGTLVVGGGFTQAGGLPAPRVASWNGSTWTSLAPIPGASGDQILTLGTHEGELIAGGTFQEIDGVTAPQAARRDGAGWQPLGSGLTKLGYGGPVTAAVSALLSRPEGLFLGGDFNRAGVISSMNLALWGAAAGAAPGHDDAGRRFGIPARDGPGDPDLERDHDEAMALAKRPTAPPIRWLAPPTATTGSLTFEFELREPRDVTLQLFDVGGRRRLTAGPERRAAGRQPWTLRTNGEAGGMLPAGLYFLRLSAGPDAAITARVVVTGR